MDLSITLFLHFAIMRLTVYSTFNVKHTVFSSTWVNVLSHFKPWKKQTLPGGQGQEHLLPRDTSVGTRCRDEHCCCGRSLVGPDGHLNYPVWGADLWIHFETIFTIWTLSVRQRSFSLQLPSRFTPTATSRSSRNVSARGFISPRYPSFCQSRCFYLCVSFLFSNGRYLILEWSSSFGAGVSDRTEWGGGGKGEGRLNPRRPAPDSGHKPVRVYISPPPLSSGKLARLMLWQRDGGADGVSRWPVDSAVVALARHSVASDRSPGFMSRVKLLQAWGPGPVSSSLGHLVICLSNTVSLHRTAFPISLVFMFHFIQLKCKDFCWGSFCFEVT